jgi:hypothetical protein
MGAMAPSGHGLWHPGLPMRNGVPAKPLNCAILIWVPWLTGNFLEFLWRLLYKGVAS